MQKTPIFKEFDQPNVNKETPDTYIHTLGTLHVDDDDIMLSRKPNIDVNVCKMTDIVLWLTLSFL